MNIPLSLQSKRFILIILGIIFFIINIAGDSYSFRADNLQNFSFLHFGVAAVIIVFFNKIYDWFHGLNFQQKTMVGVLFPIIYFFSYCPFIYENSNSLFNFEKTWCFWIVYLVIICFLGLMIFNTRSQEIDLEE